MSEKDETIELPEAIFRLLRDLIKDYCGIYFDDSSRYILERRLANRLRLQHMRDFREYYRYLMYDKRRDDELAAIIDILTVNETYFFREQNQLKAFIDEIIPEIYERNKEKKRIRIWSAGCSTGEEPYTIAILVLEKGIPDNWDIDIVASDINQRVLQVARKGVYKKNSFRTTNNYFLLKYFEEEQGGNFKISDAVKNVVNFSYLNILDPFKVKFVGQVDVIFCRNVFIYFDNAVRKRVVKNFYDRLVEGGYLLLGHAESLMNISTAFTLSSLKNDMVYQKP
ncbi:MAG TPA: chemotaxis protein CheR, partial [Nitrospiraceae bacterium]|nr:chemotaxis protein CheR [Nitrospiraceae bacterium]